MVQRRSTPRHTPLATFLALAVAISILYFAQEVLKPVVLSALLAFLLARPAEWLERRRVGRVPAVVGVVFVAFIAIGSVGYVVGQQAYSLADNLPNYQDEIQRKIRSVSGTGSGLGSKLEQLSKDFQKASETPATQKSATTVGATTRPGGVVDSAVHEVAKGPSEALAREVVKAAPATAPAAAGTTPANPMFVREAAAGTPFDTLLAFLSNVAGPLATAGLVVVFVVFILLEREALRDRLIAVISRGNYTVTTRAINDAAERISRYLLAQSIVNGSYGVIIGTGLFLIGLIFGHGQWFPSFVLWGLLCAVLRFIPYVGPAVSSLFPVALALAVYPGFTVAIAVVILFTVIEMLSNNVMEPWLYGASTGLSTVAILVAAIFWTWLWGTVGLLVATPLTVCMAVIGKYVTPLNFLHVLLGDEEGLPPAVGFYQRLLAGDCADAERIVRRVTAAQGVGRVPDVIYLPALRMARRDRAEDRLTAEDETRIFDDTLSVARPPGAIVSPAAPASVPAAASPPALPLVLACPAHHRADEVTLHVLAEALVPLGVRTAVMSTRSLPGDVETTIEREKPLFVVIAVMPPGGFPQTRYLCQRLRRRFPDLPILVGYWGRFRNFDRLLIRLRKSGASYVLTNVGQTRDQIAAMLPKPSATEPAMPQIVSPS